MPRLRPSLGPFFLLLVIGCSQDMVTSPARVPVGLLHADVIADCDNLQETLDNASPGDLILIPQGSICTGHYHLPSLPITLMGEGSGATFDGEGSEQILAGRDVQNTVIRNLTFINGDSEEEGGAIWIGGNSSPTISGSTFIGNSARQGGGAISIEDANGTIENSTFLGNTSLRAGGAVSVRTRVIDGEADLETQFFIRDNVFGSATQPNTTQDDGGAIYLITSGGVALTGNRISNSSAASGGGVYLEAASGVISGNTISANSTSGPGGGIVISGNWIDPDGPAPAFQFTLDGNIIKNNTAAVPAGECGETICSWPTGGGLYLTGATAAGANNTFSGNSAQEGGGIFVERASLALTGSTISANTAVGQGGGIRSRGVLSLTNSTVSSNVARDGGGLYVWYSSESEYDATLLNSTIADNRATNGTGGGLTNEGTVLTTNSIFARNFGTASIPGNCSGDPELGGQNPESGGHNLEDADTCGFNGSPGDGDIVGRNAILGPLADNGGPTFTHALGAGSPAIDAANNALCPATDQRGQSRPKDGNGDRVAVCDIGSYELDAAAPPPAVSGLKTKHLRINFGSHGGENTIDWSGGVGFPSGGVINPVTEPVTIKIVSGGVVVFSKTLAPGSFVREPDGSFRYRSPKGTQPELDLRFKPRGDGTYDFKFGVDGINVAVPDRSAVDVTMAVGSKTVSQTLPLTDKGKSVEYKQN